MVASKMGLLRRTAKWNLWYMNVGLDLDFGCPLLFLFYVYRCDICQITLCLTDFVTEQDGLQFMSRLSTVTFSVLVNRPPTGIFSIIGVWVKWIVGARGGILFWFPGGKGNWDFTLLYSYRWPYIIFLWRCTTELCYLCCLLLCFETPELKMKCVQVTSFLWESIGRCLRLRLR